jgi:NAD-dependent DNA ligase
VAVGVPGIGPATCKSLARHFDDFDELLLAGRERLEAVPGVNEKAANNLRDFFASPGGERLVTRLRKLEML